MALFLTWTQALYPTHWNLALDDTAGRPLEQRLGHLAKATGRTKVVYLRELVARGLEELEDYYLADTTLARVRSGEETVHSLDDVERDLGLAD